MPETTADEPAEQPSTPETKDILGIVNFTDEDFADAPIPKVQLTTRERLRNVAERVGEKVGNYAVKPLIRLSADNRKRRMIR